MISDEVLAWYAGYERSWRERDPDGVERLFTEDAHYRVSPYAAPEVGHTAIKAIWPEDERDDVHRRGGTGGDRP